MRSAGGAGRCRGLHYVLMSFQHSEPEDFFCSSDQPCSDAYLKIRQTLNSVLPLEGIAASSFQTASSVLQGTGSLVSAPIQALKWKECKRRGQKRGEEGGRRCRDTGRKQVKKWRQRGKEKSQPRLEMGEWKRWKEEEEEEVANPGNSISLAHLFRLQEKTYTWPRSIHEKIGEPHIKYM